MTQAQGVKGLIHGSKPLVMKSLVQIFIQKNFYDSLRNSSFDDGEISHEVTTSPSTTPKPLFYILRG